MAPQYIRGGMPRKISGTASATADQIFIMRYGGVTNHVVIKNTGGTNALLVCFDAVDFSNGEFWTIAAGAEISWPVETGDIWVKAGAATTTYEIMAFIRRG